MLLSRRRVGLEAVGASIELSTLRHSGFRIDLLRAERVTVDCALLPLAAWQGPYASLLLDGNGTAATLPAGRRRRVEAGSLLFGPSEQALSPRWEGRSVVALSLRWRPGSLGGQVALPGALSIGPGARAAAARLAAEVAGDGGPGGGHAMASSLSALLVALAGDGAPLSPLSAEALIEPVPERAASIARTLDQALSNLSDRPAAVDLQDRLQLSQRHLSRLLAGLPPHYRDGASGWREALLRWRLSTGAVLMTNPAASTSAVAIALGYSSPSALCRAFAQAGLPSPASLRGAA